MNYYRKFRNWKRNWLLKNRAALHFVPALKLAEVSYIYLDTTTINKHGRHYDTIFEETTETGSRIALQITPLFSHCLYWF